MRRKSVDWVLCSSLLAGLVSCSGAPAPAPPPAYSPPVPGSVRPPEKRAAGKTTPPPSVQPKAPAEVAPTPEEAGTESPLLLGIPRDRTDEKTGIHWLFNSDLQKWFSETEVTVEQFRRCVDAGWCAKTALDRPSRHFDKKKNADPCNHAYDDRGNYPMNCVDWPAADTFCRWAGGRLPREVEWFTEASNTGTRYFPWGNDKATCVRAVMGPDGCGEGASGPVCSKLSGRSVNALCDMAGNLWEWTSTRSYQDASKRVTAGGSWQNASFRTMLASSRTALPEEHDGPGLGFRCVSAPSCDRLEDEVQLAPDEIRQPGTCLVWKRCPLGKKWDGIECSGSAKELIWQQATRSCPKGFRLPSRHEYIALLGGCNQTGEFLFAAGTHCNTCLESATCKAMFDGDTGNCWTATPSARGLASEAYADFDEPVVSHMTDAWSVDFYRGDFSRYPNDTATVPIRCVRTAMTELPSSAGDKSKAVFVEGGLSAGTVKKIARSHWTDLDSCARALPPPGQGTVRRVAVKLIVTGTGAVQTAAVAESNLGNPEVENCIAQAVRRWTFPQPEGGGIVTVTCPFFLDSLEKPLETDKPREPAPPSGPGTINLTSERSCWAVLISEDEAKKGKHGWWSVWEEKKNRRDFHSTPHVFEKLRPGKYTLVVFDPASENYDPNNGRAEEQSDGVVLQSLVVSPGAKLDLHVKDDDFIEWNCLSCPWLYVFDGSRYVRTVEVLRDIVGKEHQTQVVVSIPRSAVIDGRVRLRIAEERDEITFLDRVVLRAGSVEMAPSVDGTVTGTLLNEDGRYRQLVKGTQVEIDFSLPAGVPEDSALELVVTGYYDPDEKMLEERLRSPSGR